MRAGIIIGIVILGVLGGGYFLLNPSEVYVNPDELQMREIVIDDGESTLKKKFIGDGSEGEIINEGQTIKIEVPTTTPVEVPATTTASSTEKAEPEEIIDPNTYTLTLGDGKLSSAPKSGSVFSCQDNFPEPSVKKSGPWIQKDLWYPLLKVAVAGNIYRTNASIDIESSGNSRIVKGNGLPLHGTGEFPVSPKDNAYKYDKNPNSIAIQDTVFVVPLNPELSEAPSCLPMGAIGITLTGVVLFNALDANGRDALAHEVQDSCGGHPAPGGIYHYHSESSCLTKYAKENSEEIDSLLLGYAIDGFGIYSNIENKEKLTNDDLDSCHGHSHEITWDGENKEMYHYHATAEYPYTLGCFMGTPVLENN